MLHHPEGRGWLSTERRFESGGAALIQSSAHEHQRLSDAARHSKTDDPGRSVSLALGANFFHHGINFLQIFSGSSEQAPVEPLRH